ncbi:putative pentatricopeptide repeat-containing protein [Acorus gramineus]|uniref:Pentatricopeptide repeat-containing protein n=1 Tax=Acorus gramineus TaxID=55184 RepID=A0AAV9ATE2_ACOGR|nr:putative pentatricopeptide repeat-containing protein [Acorus gramineus]
MHPFLKSTVRSVHFFSLTRFPPKNSNEERLKPPVQGDPVRRINGYDELLTECIDRRALDDGRGVHGHMIKAGFVPRVYLQTRLILFYVRCDSLMDARKLFEGMRDRNIATWTTMISGCSRMGHDREARDLFGRMLGTGKAVIVL